ncbi:MAG: response regulator [Methylobacteriaceae bacterium]|nr:response regulator [Methylobacteriaceae bacterium]MBV9245608.1 response regulator [Methylobacteriaceae bacterium]MBV9635009.1 response regulator [Methylobacteriaceae bacterium]MBV9704379.1 response regulator [Methylobacteriaceae bacterium]
MSYEKGISAHLPYLRRFARALTGSQSSGDAYVAAALEAIVADPASFDPGADQRVALYRLFLDIWSTIPLNNATSRPRPLSPDEAGATRHLDTLTPRPRVAFLLSAVEGFNTEELARTLRSSPSEALALLDEANREIADQMRTDVLIIEDEPLIALDIESLVEELGHRVTKVARTHREALAAAREAKPGLILADIQLADGSSGLDAANEILRSYEVPVIFVTAYPERFLTGAPPEPTFLIAKPFRVDTLKAVISQALFFDRKSHPRENLVSTA